MATYNDSVIEALAGWGAGGWGDGVWGTSTEPLGLQVYGLTMALAVTETIAPLETEVSNGNWYPAITETVTAAESMTTIMNMVESNFGCSFTPVDTITNAIPWAAINTSSTPNWTQITVP
jgi:hypothetical protein